MQENQTLAEIIKKAISKGFIIDKNTIEFIEDSLGISQPEDIKQILTDKEHPERYMLIRLIFYPDKHFILTIEPHLNKPITEQEQEKIKAYVVSNLDRVKMTLPNNTVFSIPLSKDIIDTLFDKLYLDRSLPKDLISVMKENLGYDEFCLIKFRLRKESCWLNKNKYEFFKQLFINLKDFGRILPIFNTALNTLYEFKDSDDLYMCFVYKKTHLILSLKKAADIEKMLKENVIEKVIMQKQAVLTIDKDKIFEDLRTIDLIGEKVFKKPVGILDNTYTF